MLDQVIQGSLKAKEASQLLGLRYRQTLRVKKRFKQQGWAGILRKAPPKPPNLKFSASTVELILKLRKEFYYDFNHPPNGYRKNIIMLIKELWKSINLIKRV